METARRVPIRDRRTGESPSSGDKGSEPTAMVLGYHVVDESNTVMGQDHKIVLQSVDSPGKSTG